MIDENRSQEAWDLHQSIIENEKIRRKLLIDNTVTLSFLYANKLYKNLLGDENGEWAGYLSDIQIFYSRNQVNTFLKVYNKLTKKLGVDPSVWVQVPITRLTDVLPVIDQDNYEKWLINAQLLTTRDWNIEVRKAKGKVTEEEHEIHEDNLYAICKKCGRKTLLDKDLRVAEHNHA